MYPYHGRATDARVDNGNLVTMRFASATSTVMTVAIGFLCSALLVGADFPGLPSLYILMASTPSSVTVRSITTNIAVIFMVPSTFL